MVETCKGEEKKDIEAIMAVFKNQSVPGAPHKLLERLEGSWNTRFEVWMGPGRAPVEGMGACEQKMILGGRYLLQEYRSKVGGEPYSGMNILGYDNVTKRYVSAWMNTMDTGIYLFEGTTATQDNSIVQECRHEDPVRGPMFWRTVTRIIDDTLIEFEMYWTPKVGNEEKVLGITLTRTSH